MDSPSFAPGRFRLRVHIYPPATAENNDVFPKRSIMVAKGPRLPLPDLTIRQLYDEILRRYKVNYPDDVLFGIKNSQDESGSDLYLDDRVGDLFQDNEVIRIFQGSLVLGSVPPDSTRVTAHLIDHNGLICKKRSASDLDTQQRPEKRQKIASNNSNQHSHSVTYLPAPGGTRPEQHQYNNHAEAVIPDSQVDPIEEDVGELEQALRRESGHLSTSNSSPVLGNESVAANEDAVDDSYDLPRLPSPEPGSSPSRLTRSRLCSNASSDRGRARLKIVPTPRKRLLSQERCLSQGRSQSQGSSVSRRRSLSVSTSATTPVLQQQTLHIISKRPETKIKDENTEQCGAVEVVLPSDKKKLQRPSITFSDRLRGVSASSVYEELETSDREEPATQKAQPILPNSTARSIDASNDSSFDAPQTKPIEELITEADHNQPSHTVNTTSNPHNGPGPQSTSNVDHAEEILPETAPIPRENANRATISPAHETCKNVSNSPSESEFMNELHYAIAPRRRREASILAAKAAEERAKKNEAAVAKVHAKAAAAKSSSAPLVRAGRSTGSTLYIPARGQIRTRVLKSPAPDSPNPPLTPAAQGSQRTSGPILPPIKRSSVSGVLPSQSASRAILPSVQYVETDQTPKSKILPSNKNGVPSSALKALPPLPKSRSSSFSKSMFFPTSSLTKQHTLASSQTSPKQNTLGSLAGTTDLDLTVDDLVTSINPEAEHSQKTADSTIAPQISLLEGVVETSHAEEETSSDDESDSSSDEESASGDDDDFSKEETANGKNTVSKESKPILPPTTVLYIQRSRVPANTQDEVDTQLASSPKSRGRSVPSSQTVTSQGPSLKRMVQAIRNQPILPPASRAAAVKTSKYEIERETSASASETESSSDETSDSSSDSDSDDDISTNNANAAILSSSIAAKKNISAMHTHTKTPGKSPTKSTGYVNSPVASQKLTTAPRKKTDYDSVNKLLAGLRPNNRKPKII